MTIVATEDSRNLEWRKSNVGSALLQKMGWKEGQAIGKRSKTGTSALRALRRQEGLGLGAKVESQGGESERSDHFSSVLQNLQETHGTPSKRKQVTQSSDGQKLFLAQNRVIAGHAQKVRKAKFGAKSAEDMACIFGSTDPKTAVVVASVYSPENPSEEMEGTKKRKTNTDKKKKTKKRKKN